MTFYSRVKLPPLKLTQGSANSKKLLFRGVRSVSGVQQGGPSTSIDDKCASVEEKEQLPFVLPEADSLLVHEPTHHELQSKASVRGWKELRNKLLAVLTECSAMPLNQICILCPRNALYRCQECGPLIFYCMECFCSQHQTANFFHVAEQWDVS